MKRGIPTIILMLLLAAGATWLMLMFVRSMQVGF
jgi:hypothetical protein